MTSFCGSVDKRQRSLFDNCPCTSSIALEIYNEKSDPVVQFRELKPLFVFDVNWLFVFKFMVNFGFKSIKIDSGIKGFQILPIISLCVELKHSNMDCINIFDIKPKLNELLWLILIFILWSKE